MLRFTVVHSLSYSMVIKLSSGTTFEYGNTVPFECTSPLYRTIKDGSSVKVFSVSRQKLDWNMLREEKLVTIVHDRLYTMYMNVRIKIIDF